MKLSKIGYYLLKGVSRMPFWFIYFLSDVAAWILFFVVRYRRKVVMDNLRLCFPDESPSCAGGWGAVFTGGSPIRCWNP